MASVPPYPGRNGRPGLPRVAAAVEHFLDSIQDPATRADYAQTLAHLIDLFPAWFPVVGLDCEHYEAVMSRWDDAAPATRNRHLSALTSFTNWAQQQNLLGSDPASPTPPPSTTPQTVTGTVDHSSPATTAVQGREEDRNGD